MPTAVARLGGSGVRLLATTLLSNLSFKLAGPAVITRSRGPSLNPPAPSCHLSLTLQVGLKVVRFAEDMSRGGKLAPEVNR